MSKNLISAVRLLTVRRQYANWAELIAVTSKKNESNRFSSFKKGCQIPPPLHKFTFNTLFEGEHLEKS